MTHRKLWKWLIDLGLLIGKIANRVPLNFYNLREAKMEEQKAITQSSCDALLSSHTEPMFRPRTHELEAETNRPVGWPRPRKKRSGQLNPRRAGKV